MQRWNSKYHLIMTLLKMLKWLFPLTIFVDGTLAHRNTKPPNLVLEYDSRWGAVSTAGKIFTKSVYLFNPHFPDFKRSQNQIHATPFNPQLFPYLLPYFPMFFPCFAIFSHVCPMKISMKSIFCFPPGKPWRWPWTASRPPARPFYVQHWRDLCSGVITRPGNDSQKAIENGDL